MRSALQWIVNGAGLLLAAGGVLFVWGPWPAAKDLALNSLPGWLGLMKLAAQKGDLLVSLLTVGLGLLVVLFGRHFKAGWRSHTHKIAIGLSTVALASLAIQAALETIVGTAHPHNQQEYDRIFGLPGGLISRLLNANSVVYLAALIWWIAWLWRDEPGTSASAPTEAAKE